MPCVTAAGFAGLSETAKRAHSSKLEVTGGGVPSLRSVNLWRGGPEVGPAHPAPQGSRRTAKGWSSGGTCRTRGRGVPPGFACTADTDRESRHCRPEACDPRADRDASHNSGATSVWGAVTY